MSEQAELSDYGGGITEDDDDSHPRWHEITGFAVFVLSVVLNFWGWLGGGLLAVPSIPQNVALFNLSVIAIAMYFPLREHDIRLGHWGHQWFLLLISAGMISYFVTYPQINPAAVNIFFGGWIIMWYGLYKKWIGLSLELFAVFMLLGGIFSGIYVAAPHMPEGRAQTAAMGIRGAMDATVVPVAASLGDVIWNCVMVEDFYSFFLEPLTDEFPFIPESPGDTEACQQRITDLASDLQDLFLSFPGGQYAWDAAVYVSQRSFDYASGMACIGGQGGLSGIAYEHPANEYDPEDQEDTEEPYGDVQSCFVDEEGEDGEETDDTSVSISSCSVSGGDAEVTYSTPPDEVVASDYTVTGPDGSDIGVTGASGTPSTGSVTLSLDSIDTSTLSTGDPLSISGPGGSCTADYSE